jgi:hypothetical protein
MDLRWDARRKVWLAYGCGFLGAMLEASQSNEMRK